MIRDGTLNASCVTNPFWFYHGFYRVTNTRNVQNDSIRAPIFGGKKACVTFVKLSHFEIRASYYDVCGARWADRKCLVDRKFEIPGVVN